MYWKHTLLGGVEISRERASIDTYTGLTSEQTGIVQSGTGSVSGVSVFNPQFTYLPFGAANKRGLPNKIAIDTNSVYVMDSANYQDTVILNGGVRYDDYTINASGYGATAATFGTQSQQVGMPNFNVGAVYKPMPIGSLYAAYATSSNPTGAEYDGTSTAYGGISPTATANQVFGPEKNTSVEVGTKWELFDRHLLVTGALFQTTKDNARESRTINGQSVISAGAAYQIRGIDLSVGGKVTDKLSIFGGLVLMESEVTKSLVPPANTALFASNVGLQLANIAHQSFNMLAKYQLTDVWEIGGSATYKSKIYGGTFLAANQGTVLPSYWRFDTFVEAKISKNWSAKLFVNNIFDQRYYDALYQSATPFVLEAPGRSASFVLSGRF